MPDDDRHSGVLWPLAKESGDDFVESRDPAGYALDDKGRYMFDLFDSIYLDCIDTPANVIDDEQDEEEAGRDYDQTLDNIQSRGATAGVASHGLSSTPSPGPPEPAAAAKAKGKGGKGGKGKGGGKGGKGKGGKGGGSEPAQAKRRGHSRAYQLAFAENMLRFLREEQHPVVTGKATYGPGRDMVVIEERALAEAKAKEESLGVTHWGEVNAIQNPTMATTLLLGQHKCEDRKEKNAAGFRKSEPISPAFDARAHGLFHAGCLRRSGCC